MDDFCRDCGHGLEDHDQEAGLMVGACLVCDCDGFVSADDLPEEDDI